MADADDAIRNARGRVKNFAATLLVRKEELENKLRRYEAEGARLAEEISAVEGTDDDTEGQLRGLFAENMGLVDAAKAELAQVTAELEGAKLEIGNLEKLARDAERQSYRAAFNTSSPGDPLSASPEDIALRNVREHAANLEGRVKLERELREASGEAAAAPARPAAPAESAEDRAKRVLAEMKAARKKGSDGGGSSSSGSDGGGNDPERGPSGRTL